MDSFESPKAGIEFVIKVSARLLVFRDQAIQILENKQIWEVF